MRQPGAPVALLQAKAQAKAAKCPTVWNRVEAAAQRIWATYDGPVPTIDGLIVAALACTGNEDVLERILVELMNVAPAEAEA